MMENVLTKKQLIIDICLLLFSTYIFAQTDYPKLESGLVDDPRYYEPAFYEKVDRKSGIKIVSDIRFLKNKKGKYTDNQVVSFRKKKNPWLSKDFRIIIGCVGSCTNAVTFQNTISKGDYLYYKASFWSGRVNGYVFIFKKNQEGFYELTGLQEFYYENGDYTRNFETYIQYVDTPIQWYKGRW